MTWKADLLDGSPKCHVGVVPKQLPPSQADEYVIFEWGKDVSLRQITFQDSLCCRMQRNQTALSEFSISNEKTIRGDVLQPEINRFRQPHSRACQQSEECAVGKPAILGVGVPPDLARGLDKALHVFF
jgi:hypothetical protein